VQGVTTGIAVSGEFPHHAPDLPQERKRLDMRNRHSGYSLDLGLTRGPLTIRGPDGAAAPITLCVDGEVCGFAGDTTRAFRLNDDATDCGTHGDVPEGVR
jgi:hypothetical protein